MNAFATSPWFVICSLSFLLSNFLSAADSIVHPYAVSSTSKVDAGSAPFMPSGRGVAHCSFGPIASGVASELIKIQTFNKSNLFILTLLWNFTFFCNFLWRVTFLSICVFFLNRNCFKFFHLLLLHFEFQFDFLSL